MELTKSEFKKVKEHLAVWQERYMGKLLEEYRALIEDQTKNPSERFHSLEQKIDKDKKCSGVGIWIRGKDTRFIIQLLVDKVMTMDELKEVGLRPEIIDYCQYYLDHFCD